MAASERAPYTILIADDHAVVREGLRLMLEGESDFSVVGETGDLGETLRLLAELRPAVLLLDLHMGRELSLTVLDDLRSAAPETAVVILTMQDDPAFARQALASGADGYVLKEAPPPELMLALRTAAEGGTYLHPAMGARALVATDPARELTGRETDVLRLIALGHTNAEIADQLYVSRRTVETHRANLQRKLGVTGRAELVREALERGVMHP